jgi:hypothetical protein
MAKPAETRETLAQEAEHARRLADLLPDDAAAERLRGTQMNWTPGCRSQAFSVGIRLTVNGWRNWMRATLRAAGTIRTANRASAPICAPRAWCVIHELT